MTFAIRLFLSLFIALAAVACTKKTEAQKTVAPKVETQVCAGRFYDPAKQTCCGTGQFAMLFDPSKKTCCGSGETAMIIDSKTSLCCGEGELAMPFHLKGQQCCGQGDTAMVFDPDKKKCCNSERVVGKSMQC